MNGVYFDAAYIAKCYLKETDAEKVRELSRSVPTVSTSALTLAEMACVLHRHLRERALTVQLVQAVREQFLEDLRDEVWTLIPVTDRILRKVDFHVRELPHNVFLRAGDAIHVVSALDAGFEEIWSNDRHMLAAARHFGLKGRSVAST